MEREQRQALEQLDLELAIDLALATAPLTKLFRVARAAMAFLKAEEAEAGTPRHHNLKSAAALRVKMAARSELYSALFDLGVP